MEVYAMLALVGFGYMFSKKNTSGPRAEREPERQPGDPELAMHRQFNPDLTHTMARNAELKKAQELERAPNFIGRQGADNPFDAPGRGGVYSELAGIELSPEEFEHNNMMPHFGSRVKGVNQDADTGRLLESFQGARGDGNSMRHVESAPLFRPEESAVRSVNGAPLLPGEEGVVDRYRDSLSQTRQSERPFEQVRVGPGLAQGYTAEPSGGFHQGNTRDFVLPKTVDELRSANNPRLEYPGMMIPGKGTSQRGLIGEFSKKGPETAFESDRYLDGAHGMDRPFLRPDVTPITREEFGDTYRVTPADGTAAHGQNMPWTPTARQFDRRLPEDGAQLIGATATRYAPHKPGDFRYAGHELGSRQSEDQWSSHLRPAGGTTFSTNAHLSANPEAVRLSGKETLQDSQRVYGNMSVQIPNKPPAYDPNTYSMRTTLKETGIHDARTGNVGAQVPLFGGDDGLGTRNTVRQDQHSYNETVRNFHDAAGGGAGAYASGSEAPPTTLREATSRSVEGFVSSDRRAPGGYVSTDSSVGPTQREFTEQKNYMGHAFKSDSTGAYLTQMSNMRGEDTGTAMTSSGGVRDHDFDYYGIPRSDENKGIDYSRIYTETLNEAKEQVLKTRIPGGHGNGAKEAPNATTLGSVQTRSEPAQENYHRLANLPSQQLEAGSVQVRTDDSKDTRLDTGMVDWVSSNPYVATGVWNRA